MNPGIDGPRWFEAAGRTFVEIDVATLRQAARRAVLDLRKNRTGGEFDVRVIGRRGQSVLTSGDDEAWIAQGVQDAYDHLGAAPTAVLAATGTSRQPHGPTSIELLSLTSRGHEHIYELTFQVTADAQVRGHLFQETKATLNPAAMDAFLLRVLPPLLASPAVSRVSIAIGGTSAEDCLAMASRADRRELDALPRDGDFAGRAFRDDCMEANVACLVGQIIPSGAHDWSTSDIRVIRMVRHGGSLPIGIHVGLRDDASLTVRIAAKAHDRE